MKDLRILFCTCLAAPLLHAQVNWQSLDGPWFASTALDISIGYLQGSPVMFVADSTGQSLLKTTDEGDNWTHLSVTDPLCVACVEDNPMIVYVGVGESIKKSTDGGANWTTLSLPTGSRPTKITISPFDPQIIYAGFYSDLPPFDVPMRGLVSVLQALAS